jgi:hypothetical protein
VAYQGLEPRIGDSAPTRGNEVRPRPRGKGNTATGEQPEVAQAGGKRIARGNEAEEAAGRPAVEEEDKEGKGENYGRKYQTTDEADENGTEGVNLLLAIHQYASDEEPGVEDNDQEEQEGIGITEGGEGGEGREEETEPEQ